MKFKEVYVAAMIVAAVAAAAGLAAVSAVHAQESTALQIDRGHTGYTNFFTPPRFPLVEKWAVWLPGYLSYPVIAGGRVFVLSISINGGPGLELYAIDAASGEILWSRDIPAMFSWAALTYGSGKLFVLNDQGILAALDPATGAQVWIMQITSSSFSSAPTFSNGVIYTGGGGGYGKVYAVNAADGKLLWIHDGLLGGDNSSPAASDSTVYVSYACNQTYALDAKTGLQLWHNWGLCEGGGGETTVLSETYGLLFTRDISTGNLVLNSSTGSQIGSYSATFTPVLASGKMFVMNCPTGRTPIINGELSALDQNSGKYLWSFTGDWTLCTAPIVVNNFVFVGGYSGMLYALDNLSGEVAWSANVGAAILAPPLLYLNSSDFTGLAAGEGLIVVPASNKLVALGN